MKCKLANRSINILAYQRKIKLCFYKVVIVLIVSKIITFGCEIGSSGRNVMISHGYYYKRREQMSM